MLPGKRVISCKEKKGFFELRGLEHEGTVPFVPAEHVTKGTVPCGPEVLLVGFLGYRGFAPAGATRAFRLPWTSGFRGR